jgi:hypothetical protein
LQLPASRRYDESAFNIFLISKWEPLLGSFSGDFCLQRIRNGVAVNSVFLGKLEKLELLEPVMKLGVTFEVRMQKWEDKRTVSRVQ